jgi:hypothetical protein
VYSLVNGIGRIEASSDYVKVRVEGDKSASEVGGDVRERAHNEVISKTLVRVLREKLDKAKKSECCQTISPVYIG